MTKITINEEERKRLEDKEGLEGTGEIDFDLYKGDPTRVVPATGRGSSVGAYCLIVHIKELPELVGDLKRK
ncbi:hypothetical protein [Paenibacillus elgii]|uniref:hypothetical protein n=1 Tax=Paenibacillus elgii TaxID=189691 RepID=UPI0020413AE5|nr:hypothetical protein [Paenibacillus elgii]MCM3270541.1 hypothetical protein [Paenibacillus elgii]